MEKTTNRRLMKIVIVGLMAALVFIGNYFQIPVPNGLLVTRVHLGNSMCLLAGLLFGSKVGGLSSGIGAALFDLLTPAYVVSAPFTFISKFAMGFTAGFLNKGKDKDKIPVLNTIIAAGAGQIVYILLYLTKSFFTVLILGGTVEAAWIAVGTNAVTSLINAVLAVVIAVPLYYALKKALSYTPIRAHINEKSQSKGYFNPVTIGLTIFAFITSTIYAVNLSSSIKVQKATEAEKEALQSQLLEYENRFKAIEEKIGITYVPAVTEAP